MTAISDKINGYSLTRRWFDYSLVNAGKTTPVHGILFLWIVELFNRNRWRELVFMAKDEAMTEIGVKDYRTFWRALHDLEAWGFISIVGKAKNQHTTTIIKISCAYASNASAEGGTDTNAYASNASASTGAYASNASAYASAPAFNVQAEVLNDELMGVSDDAKHKTIKKTIKTKVGVKSALPENDFLMRILNTYCDVFKDEKNINIGKNKKAAAGLAKLWKSEHPNMNTEEILMSMRSYFEQIARLRDSWYKQHITPTIALTHYTPLQRMINNPIQKHQERPKVLESDNLIDLQK